MSTPFTAPAPVYLPVAQTPLSFPVHRVYCIGRNYLEHAKEMGSVVDRERPIFFMKPADALQPNGDVPYPPATQNLHYEVEMVVALKQGGHDIPCEQALDCIYAYAVGLDLTRRDLQAAAKQGGLPWDAAKSFDHSAPLSTLHKVSDIGHPDAWMLSLTVNGESRQQGRTDAMIHNVASIIHKLSLLWLLQPGDVIFTGTPAGVGALQVGDQFRAELEGFAVLEGRILPSI